METVKCKWCGAKTRMLGTKECDRCWELRCRIEGDLKIAKKIIATIEKEKGTNKRGQKEIIDSWKELIERIILAQPEDITPLQQCEKISKAINGMITAINLVLAEEISTAVKEIIGE